MLTTETIGLRKRVMCQQTRWGRVETQRLVDKLYTSTLSKTALQPAYNLRHARRNFTRERWREFKNVILVNITGKDCSNANSLYWYHG